MPVYMQSQVRRITFDQVSMERSARAILADVGETSADLGILFVGDQRMRSLNRRYRGKDRTTDVLAFAMREACAPHAFRQAQGRPVSFTPDILGDVVISVPTAWRQAIEAGRSLDEELAWLLIHGILHLCGYDHERSEKEARRMHRRERMIQRSIARVPKRANRIRQGSTGTPSRAKSSDASHITHHR
jgi:rRNA maturation RNase YbeY